MPNVEGSNPFTRFFILTPQLASAQFRLPRRVDPPPLIADRHFLQGRLVVESSGYCIFNQAQERLSGLTTIEKTSDQTATGSHVFFMNQDSSTPKRELVLLGTGTSIGVPAIGCSCAVCTSDDPRLHRTRASAAVMTDMGTLLIDCGPDLRQQCLREKIGRIDAVLMTHQHADHILGMDDLRIFCHKLDGDALPIYCEPDVEEAMRRSFWYAFDPNVKRHSKYAIPTVEFRRVDRPHLTLVGVPIEPIPLKHGHLDVLGFRLGDLAYCTDVNEIPAESWPKLEGLDTLILDALRLDPHPTHFSLRESLDVIDRVKPKQAYLTHVSCRMDPIEAAKLMPEHVALAYDGLRIPF